ncbi:MAG: S16 family serine protease [Parvularculaceae bacterium]
MRSRATEFGIEPPVFEKTDIHIHVPDADAERRSVRWRRHGDCDRLVLTGVPVHKDIAMTGETRCAGECLRLAG